MMSSKLLSNWCLTLTIVLTLALSPSIADDHVDETVSAEIDYILDTVEASDCTFIRNGKEHEADSARSHLELKRRRGKKYFETAEEFIDRLASSSSWSGKPYHIRCGEEQVLAKDWFMNVLQDYRASR